MLNNEKQPFILFNLENIKFTSVSGLYCPVIFDSLRCWNATLPGTRQVQPCPDFPDWAWSPSSKKVLYNHSWY
jgi:hypothetical protein